MGQSAALDTQNPFRTEREHQQMDTTKKTVRTVRISTRTSPTRIPRGAQTDLLIDGVVVWGCTWSEEPSAPGPNVSEALYHLGYRLTEDQLRTLLYDNETIEYSQ